MSSDFLDEARIFVAGGHGGNGSMHFRREKFVPNGGPDGGDGGRGGCVILQAARELNTLHSFRFQRRFAAEPGGPGTANRRHGKNGADVVVPVPAGTVVRDAETGALLGDLDSAGETLVVARGGQGGMGNVHFTTSTNQAPSFAEKGEPAEERWLTLELKLLADVGIVGLPNAGKSTLLATISAARPKIADYPFTTLTPVLGVVSYGAHSDESSYTFVAADIPGLIEGAHSGVGLGDQFLRHIERTVLLVHVIDGAQPDPIIDFEQVNAELRAYDPSLAERPQIVAVNKMDLPAARDAWPALRARLEERGYSAYPISSVTHAGVDDLLAAMVATLREARTEGSVEPAQEDLFVFTARPDPDQFSVRRHRKTLHVEGESVQRLARMTDFDSAEAINRLQRRMRRMGVFAALEREGVKPGDRVMIGDVEMTWEGEIEPELRPGGEQRDRGNRRRSAPGTHAYRGRRRS